MSASTIASMSGCSSGSPPAIETIGAPDSSIAATHVLDADRRRAGSRSGAGSCRSPRHSRLHAKSGSISTISGNCSRRRASVRDSGTWRRACSGATGIAISAPPGEGRNGRPRARPSRSTTVDGTEAGKRVDHPVDETFGRRGAGGDPDGASARRAHDRSISVSSSTRWAVRPPGGDLDQTVGVGRVRRADDEHQVALGGDGAHRLLAVLRGVADVVGARADDRGEALARARRRRPRVSSRASVVWVR